jgi:hypothetical protein
MPKYDASKRHKGIKEEELPKEEGISGKDESVAVDEVDRGYASLVSYTPRSGRHAGDMAVSSAETWRREAQLGFTDTLHQICQLYRHEMWGFWYECPTIVVLVGGLTT